MEVLEDAGALNVVPIDFDGNPMASQEELGLDDDAYDDAINTLRYSLSPLGAAYLAAEDPNLRIAALFEEKAEFLPVFLALAAYCDTPRTYTDVDNYIKQLANESEQMALLTGPLDSSFFLSALEKVGALAWIEGWVLTPEGREKLGGSL